MKRFRALTRAVVRTPHVPIGAMVLVALWLGFGAIAVGSWKATAAIAFYLSVMVGVYALLLQLTAPMRAGPVVQYVASTMAVPHNWRAPALWALAIIATMVSIAHYLWFDGFTLPAAMSASANFEVALIREGITNDLPPWMRYFSAFTIKSLFPIGLLLSVVYGRYGPATLFAIGGGLYAICLMQKSYAIVFLLPLTTYYLVNLRIIRALVCLAVSAALVFWMSSIANVGVLKEIEARANAGLGEVEIEDRANASPEEREIEAVTARKVEVLGSALLRRILVTPGAVVSQWIDLIPEVIPYGQGCGYRFAAPLIGCEFQNYPETVYAHLHPDWVEDGLQGSANAASMVTEYANFGVVGFPISAVFHAFVAWGLYVLFLPRPGMVLPINIIYLAFLSSTSLFTTLLSGGWALAVALFVILGQEAPAEKAGRLQGRDEDKPRIRKLFPRLKTGGGWL